MGLYQQVISFVKRKILRISRDRWNHQYHNGRWNSLHTEDDRFQAVIALLQRKGAPVDILEVGCGDAVLFRKLPAGIYRRFTGTDISDVAIGAAKAFEGPGVQFVAGDMHHYKPDGAYDVIIFNESLYYSKTPLQVLQHFRRALKPGGTFIVTAVQNKYTGPLWPAILPAYTVLQETPVKAGALVWDIKELLPAK